MYRSKELCRPIAAGIVLLCLLGGSLQAQETRGTILGRVTDSSGAVMPGVKVTATNTATLVQSSGESNATGDYLLPLLNPGVYDMTAQIGGFKTYQQQGIQLRLADRITINFSLAPGEVSDRVTVLGQAPLVEASTASTGTVIDHKRVVDLPLKDGNPLFLFTLATGVLNFASQVNQTAQALGGASAFSVNGVRTGYSEFSMDGASNTQQGSVAYAPPADMVQEFKFQTATFDVTQGFTPGATINVSLKSGANELHGNLLYFAQNPAFNANKFFSNRAGQSKAVIRMNRFGANGSGPVYIPKIYNGKNRTFFSYGWERFHSGDPRGTVNATLPTAAEKIGDFSALLKVGPQYQIYDPFSIAPAANGRFSRLPLAGNIVPPSRINATARKILDFYPAPNLPGTADGSQNWTTPGPETIQYYTHLFRIDHTVSDKNRFFVRANVGHVVQDYDNRFNGAQGNRYYRFMRGVAINDVHVFSPGFLVSMSYGYARFGESQIPVAERIDLASLGFSQTLISQAASISPEHIKLPSITMDSGAGLSTSTNFYRFVDTHSVDIDFTRVIRAHTFKFGAALRGYVQNFGDIGHSSGALTFGSTWTNGPFDNSPAAPVGQGMAALLFGLPTSGTFPVNATYAESSRNLGFYLGDDWKATSRLTLNIGLRYELENPTTERYNRTVSSFDFTSANPIDAAARANYAGNPIPQIPVSQFQAKGGLLFAGANGQARGLWNTRTHNFMPRIGLAYTVNPRTVIRTGYGLFYDLLGIQHLHVNQTGFSASTQLVSSVDNGQHYLSTLQNPFPAGFALPTGAQGGLSTFNGQSVNFHNPNLKTPYMQRWLFGVQRELTHDTVLEVNYIGNRGTRLLSALQADPVPRQYLSASATRDQAAINLLTAQVSNPFYPLLPFTGLSGTTVARSQLLRPYPQFTGITFNTNQGYSWYHSMQTSLERRFARSYTATVSWTWSKFMEATSRLNETDALPARVISDLDRTHRVVVSGLWELPFGKGQRFGAKLQGLPGRFIGGWQAQGIYQQQSGPALGFGNAIFNGNLHDIPLSGSGRTIDKWFNVNAGFDRNSQTQLASNIIYLPIRFSGIRGDGMNQWDLSLIKNTNLTERTRLQFRCEFVNAFNHAQFAAPNTTPSSTAFGTVTAENSLPRTIQFALKLIF